MNVSATLDLRKQALAILQQNDRGEYTVPTKGLYPFQWNWDSCLSALGLAHLDEGRAWTELDTLFAQQWPDGMVPHIVFHEHDDGYFPGPDVWCTGRPVATSGITQPPVAGFVVRRLLGSCRDRAMAMQRAATLAPAIDRWHQWFFANRDPDTSGLVALIHPWESGRDNSIDWDAAFERVPTEGVTPYQRRDLQHADSEHRPTKEQYDRYIWLVETFRSLGWDNAKLHDASPFRVVDPGFNAILFRSCADLAAVATELGLDAVAARNRAYAQQGIDALEQLWSEVHGQYVCYDRVDGQRVDSASIGGLLPVFAALPEQRTRMLATRIEALGARSRFLVTSHDPADVRHDSKRYWRGPVWAIVNFMIADGLHNAGLEELAARIRQDAITLIAEGGFSEYFDPHTGEPCGGGSFTWTAAMTLELLR